jgi:hypothetical protein
LFGWFSDHSKVTRKPSPSLSRIFSGPMEMRRSAAQVARAAKGEHFAGNPPENTRILTVFYRFFPHRPSDTHHSRLLSVRA